MAGGEGGDRKKRKARQRSSFVRDLEMARKVGTSRGWKSGGARKQGANGARVWAARDVPIGRLRCRRDKNADGLEQNSECMRGKVNQWEGAAVRR